MRDEISQERKAETVTLLLDMKIRTRGPATVPGVAERGQTRQSLGRQQGAVGPAAQPSSGSHAVYGAGGPGCDVWCSPVLLSQNCSQSSVCAHHNCQGRPGLESLFSDCSVGLSMGQKDEPNLRAGLSESGPITGLDSREGLS